LIAINLLLLYSIFGSSWAKDQRQFPEFWASDLGEVLDREPILACGRCFFGFLISPGALNGDRMPRNSQLPQAHLPSPLKCLSFEQCLFLTSGDEKHLAAFLRQGSIKIGTRENARFL
jgi:hypothetical protein